MIMPGSALLVRSRPTNMTLELEVARGFSAFGMVVSRSTLNYHLLPVYMPIHFTGSISLQVF